MEPLERYRAKRDFSRTPEPDADTATPSAGTGRPCFVVQRHRARRLHYDLRLEIDGVLVSWSVPRGPTLDPTVRRLAVRTEDHPLAYADFEGVIPRGEYGAGDVIVWDHGTWHADGDLSAAQQLVDGTIHVELHGEKLSGRFVLTRTGRDRPEVEQWLLIKTSDDAAVAEWDPEAHPRSVLSGLTNEQVADPDRPPPAVPSPPRWSAPSEQELASLAALGGSGTWSVDGVELSLTNLDKVLFPAGGGRGPFTKRDLIGYYTTIAPRLLPYLWDRPVNLQRFPDGVAAEGFWQKQLPSHAPDWLGRWQDPSPSRGRTEWYAVLDRPAALAWMANLGVVELHPWTAAGSEPEQPTWALIDIDPGERTSFDDVVVLSRLFRTALEHLGVQGRPKTTGQRGLQIWVPVAPGSSFERTRAWVEAVSRSVGAMVPDLVSWSWRTDERDGLARLDYTQNAHHKTLVAPWSVRPAPGAPVSVPIDWDEIEDPGLRSDRWSIEDGPQRALAHGDPLVGLVGLAQELPRI